MEDDKYVSELDEADSHAPPADDIDEFQIVLWYGLIWKPV